MSDNDQRKERTLLNDTVTASERLFRFWHIGFPSILFLSLVLIFEFTDLDLWCSDIFYDFNKGRFYWRDTGWANQLLHKGGLYAIASVVIASLIFLVWSFLMRNNRWVNWQRALIFLILSVAIGSGIAGLLKATTNRHYPTHIERYGGNVPYRKLFQAQPSGFKRSKGFPAAHASGGYSLMAFYFIFYKRNKLRAYLGLALGLAVGTLLAFGQQVRGVHFASHNIWSMAICWYGSLLLYRYPFRRNVSGPLLKPI
jgi:membrane-associated PAP2 superfamily phosphatase